jgi:hypothetical protein
MLMLTLAGGAAVSPKATLRGDLCVRAGKKDARKKGAPAGMA